MKKIFPLILIAGLAILFIKIRKPNESLMIYVVKPGDTLSKIARDNNLTLNEIMLYNPTITNPNLIYPGQIIRLKPISYQNI